MFETEYLDPAETECPECHSSFGVHLKTCSKFNDLKNFPMPHMNDEILPSYWALVDGIEAGKAFTTDTKPRPGFRKMIEWGIAEQEKRGVVYNALAHLRNSYRKHTGVEVDVS